MPSKLKKLFPEFAKSDTRYLDTYHGYSLASFIESKHLDELLMVDKKDLLEKDDSGDYVALDTVLDGFKNNYLVPDMITHATFNTSAVTFLDSYLKRFAIKYSSLSTKDLDVYDFFDFKAYLHSKIAKHEIKALEILDTGTVYLIDNRKDPYLVRNYVNDLYTARFKKDYSDYSQKELAKFSLDLKNKISGIIPDLKHDNKILLERNDAKDIPYRNRLQMLISIR